MKKLIFILTLTSSAISPAFADGNPIITVGGKVESMAVLVKQKEAFAKDITEGEQTYGNWSRKNAMSIRGLMHIKAEGVADNGLIYGGYIEGGDEDTVNGVGNLLTIQKAYTFLESNMGRFEFGILDGASKNMKIDATNISKGPSGLDGDFINYVNPNVGRTDTGSYTSDGNDLALGLFLTSPSLPLDMGKNYNKLSYYTPEVSGFQAGVTYAINSGDLGNYKGIGSKNLDGTENDIALNALNYSYAANYSQVFSEALQYKTQCDQFSIGLSATAQQAKAQKDANKSTNLFRQIHDVSAYNVGGSVSYSGFTVVGSYGNWNKSTNTKDVSKAMTAKTKYYTVGTRYEQGPAGLSLAYFQSKRALNKFTDLSVMADYNYAPGAQIFTSYHHVNFKPASNNYTSNSIKAVSGNKGNIGMGGIKLVF